MSVVLVQLKTTDYAAWKNVFEGTAAMREAAGLTNTRILRSADDPNEVFVRSDTNDLAKAKQFLTSPEVRTMMEKSGLVGPPAIHFLNPV